MDRILIIQTAFLGDVVLATPVAESLHAAYPNARIDFLLRKGSESLFRNHPFINEVLIWNKKENKYRNLFGLIQKIRNTKYDLVINCQRFAASGLLAGLSGAKTISGFKKNPFSFLFNYQAEHKIGNGKHECERNLDLIHFLKIEGIIRPRLYPVDQETSQFNLPPDYICMAPASVWFTKQLPAAKWIELGNKIIQETAIVLLGAPTDNELCESIAAEIKNHQVINLCGKPDLLQSAGIMKNARMNYVNDSAPLHLASSVNAPVTAFFCSTVPEFGFGPLSDNSIIVETTEKLSCRPCGLHGRRKCPEGHFRCADVLMG
ncbi:MAG: glycosyltransferase family 9 protein [Bacteroidetes bacterium]|nr:glycosyltransferase family 9 protein [Bacteroidota bacterium]